MKKYEGYVKNMKTYKGIMEDEEYEGNMKKSEGI